MVFEDICILVIWTKVALALEGLGMKGFESNCFWSVGLILSGSHEYSNSFSNTASGPSEVLDKMADVKMHKHERFSSRKKDGYDKCDGKRKPSVKILECMGKDYSSQLLNIDNSGEFYTLYSVTDTPMENGACSFHIELGVSASSYYYHSTFTSWS